MRKRNVLPQKHSKTITRFERHTSPMRQASRQAAVLCSASSSRLDSSGGVVASVVSREIRLHSERTQLIILDRNPKIAGQSTPGLQERAAV